MGSSLFSIADLAFLSKELVSLKDDLRLKFELKDFKVPQYGGWKQEKLGDLILKEGSKMGMIITATPVFRCRRIEAGLLSAGQDFTNKTNPYSVGLGRFIDINKENFIGKEALQIASKKCRTWGLRVDGGTAIRGKSLKINCKIVGKVTSSTWSPYQVCGVGIVHMYNADFGPGTVLDVVCTNGKIHKGELCELPMYDTKGEIVRGINKDIPKEPSPWTGIKKK